MTKNLDTIENVILYITVDFLESKETPPNREKLFDSIQQLKEFKTQPSLYLKSIEIKDDIDIIDYIHKLNETLLLLSNNNENFETLKAFLIKIINKSNINLKLSEYENILRSKKLEKFNRKIIQEIIQFFTKLKIGLLDELEIIKTFYNNLVDINTDEFEEKFDVLYLKYIEKINTLPCDDDPPPCCDDNPPPCDDDPPPCDDDPLPCDDDPPPCDDYDPPPCNDNQLNPSCDDITDNGGGIADMDDSVAVNVKGGNNVIYIPDVVNIDGNPQDSEPKQDSIKNMLQHIKSESKLSPDVVYDKILESMGNSSTPDVIVSKTFATTSLLEEEGVEEEKEAKEDTPLAVASTINSPLYDLIACINNTQTILNKYNELLNIQP